MSPATLIGTSLTPEYKFNWVFLIELLVCGVVTLFFIFYLNRFFATVVSYGIRAWTWHKYQVYIDIQAIQISILGGRIFFKGIRYHGNNETILVHEGFITWSYWLGKVRELDLGRPEEDRRKRIPTDVREETDEYEHDASERQQSGTAKGAKLPCRLGIRLKGVEWFIYNRTPAYEDILSKLAGENDGNSEIVNMEDEAKDRLDGMKTRFGSGLDKVEQKADEITRTKSELRPKLSSSSSEFKSRDLRTPSSRASNSTFPNANQDEPKGQQNSILLQFLPIHIECSKAAIVMGNENTRSVLIVKLDKAAGEIDAAACRDPDLYRQLINFDLEHPVVQMKANDDYKEDQTTAAIRINHGTKQKPKSDIHPKHTKSYLHRLRRRWTHKLQNLIPAFRNSVESLDPDARVRPSTSDIHPHAHWQGLSRYLDEDEQDDKARWGAIEYAVVSTIVDCPRANISYYWDIPGQVPSSPALSGQKHKTDINGDSPPGFGLDLYIEGGTINYGPWADRQRADIQKVFFPSISKNAEPAKKLPPGQARVATEFKLYVQLDDETTLRVPIREESKNWKWKKQADNMGQHINDEKKRAKSTRKKKNEKGQAGPEIRPFGWIDVKVAANSTISYSMDMVAGCHGFTNGLHIDIPSTEITTSVNHGLLWKSVDQHISCDLSNPLEWNGLHSWKFDIVSNGLELFILREHIFLITDLVDDWASGPPPEYLTFSPFNYSINLDFKSWRLYMNTNDSNIINNPADFDDNTYLIIFGTQLDADLLIPIDRFRPYRNDITFDVTALTGGLNLHVPPWNTQATFLTNTELAVLKDLAIAGKYQYCSTTSTSNTDTLLLDVHANDFQLQLYGFVIRYFLTLKENYFGDSIHFKTMEEYQQLVHPKVPDAEVDPATIQPHKKSNDLDVILTISADDNCLIIPANLYSAKNHVRIEIASLSLDLRFTNYYMDMQLNLCPLAFSLGREQAGAETPMAGSASSQLYIDSIEVYGHRVFGLPHSEPTYVCNWDFTVGSVTGECSVAFLSKLVAGVKGIAFSIDDEENALPKLQQLPLHDITFLRASVEPVRVWLHIDEAAFLFSTGAIQANFDDWAGSHFSKRLNLEIPDLTLACVDGESASRHRTRIHKSVETHAYIQTTIAVNTVDRKIGFQEDRLLQQLWVQHEDSRTHRAEFLLHPEVLEGSEDNLPDVIDLPAMCFPPLPIPIESDGSALGSNRSSNSIRSSARSFRRLPKSLQHKSSFLSTVSSSQSSQRSVVKKGSNLPSAQSRRKPTPDSRSRSRAPRASPGALNREHSGSTGRQSSFYSAVGDHGDRRGLPPSTVTFTSSYIAPYFPLDAVEPDLKDVPELHVEDYSDDTPIPNDVDHDLNDSKFDNRALYSSFIIDLRNGIRASCNPEAINAVAGLVEAMQAVNPADIIDVLQIESITDIFAQNKKKIMTGKNTDIRLIVPMTHVRFANAAASTTSSYGSEIDQYDIVLGGLTLTSRSGLAARDSAEDIGKRTSQSALHVKLRSASMSAKERMNNMDNAQAAVSVGLEDLVFWMATDKVFSANLRLRSADIFTKSHKVEYLASLIHRTSRLTDHFIARFEALAVTQHNRIQLFTYLVTSAGSATTDPLFLTRPSYVLRSANEHLRIEDTWKVVTRMRCMYRSLNEETQHDITMRCISNVESCPVNVRQQVLEGFDQWRSWDLENLADCIVAQKVFGPLNTDLSPDGSSEIPAKISLAIDSIRLVLDPGPKQNEVAFSTLGADVNIMPPAFSDNISEVSEEVQVPVHSTVVKLYCVDTAINLNWELIELAENVLKLYKQTPLTPKDPLTVPAMTKKSTAGPARTVHIVIATEKGSITLDSINLRIRSISKGLKSSIILAENLSKGVETVSVMVAAEAGTTKIKSRAEELAISQVRHPSIYVSYENQMIEDLEHNTFKVSATAQELTLVLQQDANRFLDIANLIIGDELAQAQKLIRQLPNTPNNETKSSSPALQPSTITRVNIAMFLDMYHISVPVVQSLTYNISGVVARASVAARLGADIVFDFDIKENVHDIQTTANSKTRSISLLQMPPTNGRITSHTEPEEHVVSILASVEPVELDAAAIHSLLSALNRPEMVSVVGEIRENLQGVNTHLEEVLGPKKQVLAQPVQKPSRQLVYDAHMAFAGLHIFADTPEKNGDHARLAFSIGSVQLEAANRLDRTGPPLQFPEVRVGLRDILFELSRITPTSYEPCGNFAFAANFTASSKESANGNEVRSYHVRSDALEVNLFADTASTVVDVMGHLQTRLKDLDLSREKQYLQRLRKTNPRITVSDALSEQCSTDAASTNFFDSMYSLELLNIQVSWIVSNTSAPSSREKEDLVLSFTRIDLSTRKENGAKLTIEDLQLQMVPASASKKHRSQNSALLPEMIFNVAYVSTPNARRLAFQAVGKSLDIRLMSQFIIPAANLHKSIQSASEKVRTASATWSSTPASEEKPEVKPQTRKPFFGKKRMESLLVDADFAGAVVHLTIKKNDKTRSIRLARAPSGGKYGQFSQEDAASSTTLRAPGLAWKVEFKDNGVDDPSLHAEVKVDASSNILYPTVVPLILEISSTVKEVVGSNKDEKKLPLAFVQTPPAQKFIGAEDENILTTDPSAVLGRTRLNLGLRICKQDFSLSCQPIARVAATAKVDDIYITINTVKSSEHGHFFAVSSMAKSLQASVQHVYSRESTGSLEVESVVLSVMNSKHTSGTSGMSVILNISPMKVLVNAKQLQDFLLFREIWFPPELRSNSAPPAPNPTTAQYQTFLVQRYQQVAATGAFPWNASIHIAEMDVQLDLGQAIGKSAFRISKFWVSSKKNSDWEQNLCLGIEKVGVDSTGRMSGFVNLQDFAIRTSIRWPEREKALSQTPLIQASLSFSGLRVKAAFDYQPFLVADITRFEFLMYNVHTRSTFDEGDRLVAILDGDAVQVFCTTTTASQALALYQAFERLVQEKRANYLTSLREIEKFMKRKSVIPAAAAQMTSCLARATDKDKPSSPVSLHTDVVVTLKQVNLGAFPSTFHDQQVLKLEAFNAQARFAVAMEDGKIHSSLGLTLGQLRIGLAGVRRPTVGKITGDVSVEEVVESATSSRGGTILKVPKVDATMETWQSPNSNHIDFIFKSAFEGKVEVGWNYSRISYIRGMYGNHTRALAQRLGKPLPPSAVKITGVPKPDEDGKEREDREQQKITAEVTVPQSKYDYRPLQPSIIQTPQLKDMGEATPPLEWIGLHRDRLPNLTHQIVIVTLLEVASEVEEAYAKILGSS